MKKQVSLKTKLYISIVIGCMIPYILGGFAIREYLNAWTYDDHGFHAQVLLKQASETIDRSLMDNMEQLIGIMANDQRVLAAAGKLRNYSVNPAIAAALPMSQEERNLSHFMENIKKNIPGVNFIAFGTEDGGYIECPAFSPGNPYDPRLRPWYQEALRIAGPRITDPYVTQVTGELVVSVNQEVSREGRPVGVISIVMGIDSLIQQIGNIDLGESGFLMLRNENGKFLIPPPGNPEWFLEAPESFKDGSMGADLVFTSYISPKSGWEYISAVPLSVLLEEAATIQRILFITYFLTLLIILFVIYLISSHLTRPVLEISQGIEEISEKDFSERKMMNFETYTERQDEVGSIARALKNMTEKIYSYLEMLEKHQVEIGDKNERLQASEEELMAQLEEIREQKEYIDFLAFHDPLTNLPNRRKFLDLLSEKVCHKEPFAVVLLDLDNFKNINDSMGHVFGDKVLKEIASRFTEMEERLGVFISRFGGDEFLILVPCDSTYACVEPFAENLTSLFAQPVCVDDHLADVRFSIGISLYPQDTGDIHQLIMNADLALYQVKNSGKNHYRFFEESMTERLQKKKEMEEILQQAMSQDQFRMVYQPVFSLPSGEVSGFEALLRMEGNRLSPGEFIPVAEETGAIIPLGRKALELVIRQIRDWQEMGLAVKPVAFNFSAAQINDIGFLDYLENLLREHQVAPSLLEMEITESIFLEYGEKTIGFLYSIREMGITIAIDDFGTGYSSLSYLTSLPVDKIKLDRSINVKFLEYENSRVMESLISLAHSLGLEVVAEGIEEEVQLARLQAGQCDYAQGYLLSMPLEVEEVTRRMQELAVDSE